MTNVVLPKLNQTGANEWADVEDNDVAIREVVNGELDNGNLSGAAGITPANLAAAAKPVTWYTPKVIATEESRTNTAYGTLTTPDEIKEVVLPTNGLIMLGYQALVKSSVAAAGRIAIHLGADQLKVASASGAPEVTGALTSGTEYGLAYSRPLGLTWSTSPSGSFVTTGQTLASPSGAASEGGLCLIFAAAGTYNISVQYKATSGSVTAKERKLWVAVLGS